jgi:methionine-R-sulfoxide reductase
LLSNYPTMNSPLALSSSRSTLWIVLIVFVAFAAGLFFLNRAKAQKKDDTKQMMNAPEKPADSSKDTETASEAKLRERITPEQYYVTQRGGTEPAFHNAYWDNHRAGIYVDVISGEPLFSSLDKFDSGTGWPSFTKALPGNHVVEKSDRALGTERTEIRSHQSNAHLGHVFEDGPAPTGLRYCMNSAALRFVPVEKLQEEGYGQYLSLFENKK